MHTTVITVVNKEVLIFTSASKKESMTNHNKRREHHYNGSDFTFHMKPKNLSNHRPMRTQAIIHSKISMNPHT